MSDFLSVSVWWQELKRMMGFQFRESSHPDSAARVDFYSDFDSDSDSAAACEPLFGDLEAEFGCAALSDIS